MTLTSPTPTELLNSVLLDSEAFALAAANIEDFAARAEQASDEERDALIRAEVSTVVNAILDSGASREEQAAMLTQAILDMGDAATDVTAEEDAAALLAYTAVQQARVARTLTAVVRKFGPFTLTPEDRDAVEQLGPDALVTESTAPFTTSYSLAD